MKFLEAFTPGGKYVSVSITGAKCALKCKYCEGVYLRVMHHASTPQKFYSLAEKLWRRGAKGLLVSGGFDKNGRLPIDSFLPVIKKVKEDFDFVISVHSGLVDRKVIIEMRKAGIDVVDYELIVDDFVIKNVMNLEKRSSLDFLETLKILHEEGPPYIAVHIPIGLNYGIVKSEYEALEKLLEFDPYIIVFLVLMPTRGTPMENVKPPSIEEVVKLIEYARSLYSGEIVLGCMRPPSYKFTLDKVLIEENIVDRIALPAWSILEKFNLKIVNACCSLPRKLLSRF